MDITKLLIYVYIAFFVVAGINHFLNPQFYDAIVPNFIPYPRFIHQFTGVLEIIIPLLFLTRYRKEAEKSKERTNNRGNGHRCI